MFTDLRKLGVVGLISLAIFMSSTEPCRAMAVDFLPIDAKAIDILFRGQIYQDADLEKEVLKVLPIGQSIANFSICRQLGHNCSITQLSAKVIYPSLAQINSFSLSKFLTEASSPIIDLWHEYQILAFSSRLSEEAVNRRNALAKSLREACGDIAFNEAISLLPNYSYSEKNSIAESAVDSFPHTLNQNSYPLTPYRLKGKKKHGAS